MKLKWIFLATLLMAAKLACGQQREIQAIIQGYPAIGTVQFYSNSRILLKLDRDGDWPRQIVWEVRESSKKRCAITFNKVGWQYTTGPDTCGIDWVNGSLSAYTFAFRSNENSSRLQVTLNTDRSSEALLTRKPVSAAPVSEEPEEKMENPERPNAVQPVDSIEIQNPNALVSPEVARPTLLNNAIGIELLSTVDNGLTLKEGVVTHEVEETQILPKPTDRREEPADSGFHQESAVNTEMNSSPILENPYQTLSGGIRSPGRIDSEKPADSAFGLNTEPRKPTLLEENTIHAFETSDTLSTEKDVQKLQLSQETPDYIFTIPPPRRKKRFNKTIKLQSEPVKLLPEIEEPIPTMSISENPDGIDATEESSKLDKSKETSGHLDNTNEGPKNTGDPYLQRGPFISVASFETLNYAISVQDQFNCPGGCIVVRSEKGLYYRIGFYPNPNEIDVVLRQTRQIYSDAWLVK